MDAERSGNPPAWPMAITVPPFSAKLRRAGTLRAAVNTPVWSRYCDGTLSGVRSTRCISASSGRSARRSSPPDRRDRCSARTRARTEIRTFENPSNPAAARGTTVAIPQPDSKRTKPEHRSVGRDIRSGDGDTEFACRARENVACAISGRNINGSGAVFRRDRAISSHAGAPARNRRLTATALSF